MKVRTMLFTGFLGMVCITVALGLLSFFVSIETLKRNKKAQQLLDSRVKLTEALAAHNKWRGNLAFDFLENSKKISVELDGHQCGFGKWFSL